MFSKKKFIFNGKARQKVSPTPSPPEPVSTESSSCVNQDGNVVDFSRFNFMGIEEFLSTLMDKSINNNSTLRKASGILAAQLKGSRAILSLRSYLSSIDGTVSALDRLMDTAYFIISAENFYLLQSDADGVNLVITHTHTDGAIGLRVSVDDITSGDGSLDKVVNCADARKGPTFVGQLDARTGGRTRNYICVPILIDKTVRGGIIVTNRTSTVAGDDTFGDPRHSPHGSDRGSSDKGSERTDNPPFGPGDEVLLAFIAANAGLAIKHKISAYKKQSSNSMIMTKPIESLPPSDVESALQLLADRACLKLDADLISVFAYNDGTKRLESTVSNDVKRFSMPIDRGIAGTAFRMGRVINVRETASDERFNREVDSKVGYKTQSLLCAPIVDFSGRPVGVMQAINKKGISHFTRHDETLICEFCSQAFSLLQNVDYLPDGADNYNASLVAKFLAVLVSTSSVSSMVKEVRRLVMDAVVCDYVGLHTFVTDKTGDYLICHNEAVDGHSENSSSVDRVSVDDIPIEVLDALRLGVVTEMSVSSKALKKTSLINFLPGVMARHALIYPIHSGHNGGYNSGQSKKQNGKNGGSKKGARLTGNNHTDCEGRTWQSSSVLIVIRNNQSLLPFLAATRDLLELFVAVLGTSLEHVISRQIQDSAIASLENNFLLANGTLGTLHDYIVLLGSGGQVIAWNRDLNILLGVDESEGVPMDVEQEQDNSSSGSSSSGSWMNGRRLSSNEEAVAHRGQHFSKWFKQSNCPELVTDIIRATDTKNNKGPVCVAKAANLISPLHPLGVWVDYQLLSLNMEGTPTDEEASSVVLVVRVREQIEEKGVREGKEGKGGIEEIDTATASKTKISLKRTYSSKGLARSMSETADACMLVDTATAMLKSVGIQFDVTSDIQRELDDAASALDSLRDHLSNVSPKSPRRGNVDRLGLVNMDVALPENLFSWDFNVLAITEKCVLVNVLGRIFESLQLMDGLGIGQVMLANYIKDIADKYHDNPFHNLHHATCVTQFSYMLIHATDAVKYLSPQQFFGVVISALVHDVDHPGNTNMFEINSQSYLSLLYNDQSVLENHHCSTAFQLMRKPSSNIFGGLSKATALDMRKTIISCVMATDMSVHFQLVDETKKILAGGDYSFSEAQDQMFLCKLLVHSADLSNPVRPFHITQAWARRISAEFNLQVAKEQELGMPVLNFMMTPDDKALCKNETGFASFVVAPMWRSLSGLFPGLAPLVQQLDSNLSSWKSMLERIMIEEQSQAAALLAASKEASRECESMGDGRLQFTCF